MRMFDPSSCPTDPADLFVELYDALPDSLFHSWEPVAWANDPKIREQAHELCEEIIDCGVVPGATVRRMINEPDHHEGVFTALLGIDWALTVVNPFTPTFRYGELAYLATRYGETGSFTSGPDEGALLPRCAYPATPGVKRAKPDFFCVHRIPAGGEAREIRHQIAGPYDFYVEPEKPLPVGCAPVLASTADLKFEFAERHGVMVYRLQPADSPELRRRISLIIERLDERGARVAVMPEASLSDSLLAYWQEEARRTATPESSLRWILVGSGPLGNDDPPYNRAVLLDRFSGDVILTQDKLNNFTLVVDQLHDWALPNGPKDTSAEEYIRQGSHISVLESSLGRLAILICEDFSRTVGWERELIIRGLSHLFVPIFSKPIMRHHWEEKAAERVTGSLGTWSVVANSLVIKKPVADGLTDAADLHTCMVMGPSDPERENYRFATQFGRATTADRLGLTRDGELPVIYPGTLDPAWSIDRTPPPQK